MSEQALPKTSSLSGSSSRRYDQWRMIKDRMARYGVAIGGMGVIVAIMLIFFYLLTVVFPMFIPASAERHSSFAIPGGAKSETLHLASEELGELAVRYTDEGEAVFFSTESGEALTSFNLLESVEPFTDEAEEPIASVVTDAIPEAVGALATPDDPMSRLAGVAEIDYLGNVAVYRPSGQYQLLQHRFLISYPDDVRTLTPVIEYPLGEDWLDSGIEDGLRHMSVRSSEDQMTVAVVGSHNNLVVSLYEKATSFLDDAVSLESLGQWSMDTPPDPEYVMLAQDQRVLYVANRKGELWMYTLHDGGEPEILHRIFLSEAGAEITAMEFVTGGFSLLIGDSKGNISQWFPVRDEQGNTDLKKIRSFNSDIGPIAMIRSEERRKGFIVAGENGQIGIYHATAQNTLIEEKISDSAPTALNISPRANHFLLASSDGQMQFWNVDNEHPEISWDSLWGTVHYEGYQGPDYIWQSSSASNDFEPKFSLMPLAFGTIKAAFYAMLFAVPLAICGAIYTAYFMTPKMRQTVKPTIEIMEALPTVILGFLAGLWLAPFIETHLPGVFTILILLPLGVLLFAFGWSRLPESIRNRVPDGWEAALLIPVVLFFGWLSMALSLPLEHLLFDGDMRSWLDHDLGVTFDQRNSIVVGIAMGFAVIPTIFSITEDAIFSVPRHLTFGSLALGATPWQTLVRVVILTASPGIFSAVMIGMGRAVGETMIVLMATGNTPIMDMNIFEGMRTLSANIAVEMPESEVGSSHYRILFLAALTLFMFTFIFNTLAEVVRQRLRVKYSSL